MPPYFLDPLVGGTLRDLFSFLFAHCAVPLSLLSFFPVFHEKKRSGGKRKKKKNYSLLKIKKMEITARVVNDATVNTTRTGKKVVNFTAVINDSFKTKEGELKQVSTFFDCSYWLREGLAQYLKKGTLVQAFGRVGVNPWTSRDGQPRATLTFHVSEIKLHGSSSRQANGQPQEAPEISTQQNDDLPF